MGDMSPGVMIIFKKTCKNQVSITGHWASQSTIQESLLSASYMSVTVQPNGMQGDVSTPGSLQPGGGGRQWRTSEARGGRMTEAAAWLEGLEKVSLSW